MGPLRLSRHARNRMRWFRLTRLDVLAVLASPARTGQDAEGNRLIDGVIRGRCIRVVLAHDDANRVISVFERKRA